MTSTIDRAVDGHQVPQSTERTERTDAAPGVVQSSTSLAFKTYDVRLAALGALSVKLARNPQASSAFVSKVPPELHLNIGRYLEPADVRNTVGTCQTLYPIYGEQARTMYGKRLLRQMREADWVDRRKFADVVTDTLTEIEHNVSPVDRPAILAEWGYRANRACRSGWGRDWERRYWSLLATSPMHEQTALAASHLRLRHAEIPFSYFNEKLELYGRLLEADRMPTASHAWPIFVGISEDTQYAPDDEKEVASEKALVFINSLSSRLLAGKTPCLSEITSAASTRQDPLFSSYADGASSEHGAQLLRQMHDLDRFVDYRYSCGFNMFALGRFAGPKLTEVENNVSPVDRPAVLAQWAYLMNIAGNFGWGGNYEERYWSLLATSPMHEQTALAALRLRPKDAKTRFSFFNKKLELYGRLIEADKMPTASQAWPIFVGISEDTQYAPDDKKKGASEKALMLLNVFSSKLLSEKTKG